MKEGKYAKTLAKILVTAIFLMRDMRRSFLTQIYRDLYGDRLRVVPLSLSPSCVTRKKTARKKVAARDPGGEKNASFRVLLAPRISRGRSSRPQDFARPFFSRGFLSRHARQTKRKRDYS